jgi:hypothetical protein
MKRTLITSDAHDAFLAHEATVSGLTVSEVLRHLIAHSKEYLAYVKLTTTVVRQQNSLVDRTDRALQRATDKAEREATRAARATEREARKLAKEAHDAEEARLDAFGADCQRVWLSNKYPPYQPHWATVPGYLAMLDETEEMYWERQRIHNMPSGVPFIIGRPDWKPPGT